MFHLTPELVDAIHDEVLNSGVLRGRSRDISLEGALAPVENRLVFGLVGDIFDLAAIYCMVIATGHFFNDGNKRTAYRSMEICLEANGVEPCWNTTEIADLVIGIAQRLIDEVELANWLRAHT